MKNDSSKQCSFDRLTRITVIIRGFLANSTGNEDVPYNPVILKSLINKEAIDFACSEKNAEAQQYPAPLTKGEKPPLFLGEVDLNGEQETLCKKLNDAFSDYSQRHKSKPGIVCLRELGILYVERQDDNSDLPLKNKVALVTGAAGAIGYGVCRGLLENGCYLAATDLPGEKLDNFTADLKQHRVLKVSFKPGAELILWLLMPVSRWLQI
jgi:hypothetical protein